MNFRNNIIRGTLAELQAPAGRDICFVSLGANLATSAGGPAVTVQRAFESLCALSDSPLLVSSLWQTAPLECPEGSPLFVNAVAAFVASESDPVALLRELLRLEKDAGRKRGLQRNEARILDLDLLLFADQVRKTTVLELPHPRLAERRFVLAPLAEIAPDMHIPGCSLTVAELLERLPGQGEIIRMNHSRRAVVL